MLTSLGPAVPSIELPPRGLSESPAPAWSETSNNQRGRADNAELIALADHPLGPRFCAWIGQSGSRYIFSVYSAPECPAFRDAILLVTVRDVTGRRHPLGAYDTGPFPEVTIARAKHELKAYGARLELHLHLVASSRAARESAIADLMVGSTRT